MVRSVRQGLSIFADFPWRLLLHRVTPASRPTTMHLQPGALVSYSASPDATYQVVNVDDYSDCVWLRRFPLSKGRLPTFGVPADQVRPLASEPS